MSAERARRISLGDYSGIAQDRMRLSEPIADGFMRAADIRRDISVVRLTGARRVGYDQVGPVRVRSLLKMPRIGNSSEERMQEVGKEDDTWYIAIDDQRLAGGIARSSDGNEPFEERFAKGFGEQVEKGLSTVLLKEKLLNGEEFNLASISSYYVFLGRDVSMLPLLEAYIMLQSNNPAEFAEGTALVAALYVWYNGFINGLNRLFSYRSEGNGRGGALRKAILPNYEDPFIRHNLPEFLMPTVPVDRLVRGRRYLGNHKGEFILNPNKKDENQET